MVSGSPVTASFITFGSPTSRIFQISTADLSNEGLYTIEVTAVHSSGTGMVAAIVKSFNLIIGGCQVTSFDKFFPSTSYVYIVGEDKLSTDNFGVDSDVDGCDASLFDFSYTVND